jgi:membrane-associated phospholipid phosphatase
LTTGCATTGDNGVWSKLVASSRSSAKQKSVWIPIAAAAVFAATSADRDVSDWAVEHQPVFGSIDNANNWSDWLSNGLVASALFTSFAQRDDAYQPLITDVVAMGSGYALSAGIKRLADRTRPDGSNNLSFPSLHATSAFSAAQVTARNLSTRKSPYAGAMKVSLFTLASASAWARVEAAQHYPSDVLTGAAIGNFFVAIGNAFLKERENVEVSYVPIGDGGELRIQWQFR